MNKCDHCGKVATEDEAHYWLRVKHPGLGASNFELEICSIGCLVEFALEQQKQQRAMA